MQFCFFFFFAVGYPLCGQYALVAHEGPNGKLWEWGELREREQLTPDCLLEWMQRVTKQWGVQLLSRKRGRSGRSRGVENKVSDNVFSTHALFFGNDESR